MDDRETQPGPSEPPGGGPVGLVERVEDERELLGIDSDARIGDLQVDLGLPVAERDEPHDGCDAAGLGELHGVAHEVQEHLPQPNDVPDEAAGDVLAHLQRDGQPLLRGQDVHHRSGLLEALDQVERRVLQRELAGLDLGEVQHVVDHFQEDAGRVLGHGEVFALLAVEIGGKSEFGHAHDAVDRRADLVGHVRQELCLGEAGGFGVRLGGPEGFLHALAIGDVPDHRLDVVGVADVQTVEGDFRVERRSVLAAVPPPEHLRVAAEGQADLLHRLLGRVPPVGLGWRRELQRSALHEVFAVAAVHRQGGGVAVHELVLSHDENRVAGLLEEQAELALALADGLLGLLAVGDDLGIGDHAAHSAILLVPGSTLPAAPFHAPVAANEEVFVGSLDRPRQRPLMDLAPSLGHFREHLVVVLADHVDVAQPVVLQIPLGDEDVPQVPVEDGHRVGVVGDDVAHEVLIGPHGLLGLLEVCDVPDRFDRPDDLAPRVAQAGGLGPDISPSGEFGQEDLREDRVRVAPVSGIVGFQSLRVGHQQVGQQGLAMSVERQGVLAAALAENILRPDAGELFHGPVPEDDLSRPVDRESRIRQEVHRLLETLLGAGDPLARFVLHADHAEPHQRDDQQGPGDPQPQAPGAENLVGRAEIHHAPAGQRRVDNRDQGGLIVD